MVKKKKYLLPFGIAFTSLPLIAWQSLLKQPGAPVRPVADVATDEDSVVCSLFLQQGVYNNDFVRNTFYSWTTKEQIEELRTQPTLLTRSQTKKGELSLFDLALQDSTFSKYPIAKVLSQDKFKNKRFGWTSAWATAMGWQKEKYGDRLLKIVLRDDAIIGSFDQDNQEKPFSFYDMRGNAIDMNVAIKNQDKIAAIYHVFRKKYKRKVNMIAYRSSGTRRYRAEHRYKRAYIESEFREFVIVNEGMIKSWSYGTQDIIAELNAEIDLLKKLNALIQYTEYGSGINYVSVDYNILQQWDKQNSHKIENHGSPSLSVYAYGTCTCIENDHYSLNRKNIEAIIDRLQKNIKLQSQSAITK